MSPPPAVNWLTVAAPGASRPPLATANSPNLVGGLAMIYAWVGEKDLAMQTLAKVIHARVGISSNTRYGSLKLDPQWDPLRGDPRFEALLDSLAPKPQE